MDANPIHDGFGIKEFQSPWKAFAFSRMLAVEENLQLPIAAHLTIYAKVNLFNAHVFLVHTKTRTHQT